jgi:YHS domain-containing protein
VAAAQGSPMKKSFGMACLLVLWMFATGALHAAECKCAVTAVKEAAEKEEKGLKCPVKAKQGCKSTYCTMPVVEDESASVEFQGRKVFFCCDGCAGKFKQSPDAFAEQAKAQWKVIDAKKEEKQ